MKYKNHYLNLVTLMFTCVPLILTAPITTTTVIAGNQTTNALATQQENNSDDISDIGAGAEFNSEINVAVHKDIYCAVNGKAINITGCVLKEKRVYVPVKPVFEAMGYTVKYNAVKKQMQIISKNNSTNILIDLSKSTISGTLSNGKTEVELNSIIEDSCTVDGITYIPIRSIGDNMYCKVNWVQSAQTVYIESPQLPVAQTEQKTQISTVKELTDNATEYFSSLIASMKSTDVGDIKHLWGIGIVTDVPIDTSEPASELETETNRVVQDYLSTVIELHNEGKHPYEIKDTCSEWNSQTFVGYDTFNGHLAEAERLTDRLQAEEIVTKQGKECILSYLMDLVKYA